MSSTYSSSLHEWTPPQLENIVLHKYVKETFTLQMLGQSWAHSYEQLVILYFKGL